MDYEDKVLDAKGDDPEWQHFYLIRLADLVWAFVIAAVIWFSAGLAIAVYGFMTCC